MSLKKARYNKQKAEKATMVRNNNNSNLSRNNEEVEMTFQIEISLMMKTILIESTLSFKIRMKIRKT